MPQTNYRNQREYEVLLATKEIFELDKQIANLKAKRRLLEMQLQYDLGRYDAAEYLDTPAENKQMI